MSKKHYQVEMRTPESTQVVVRDLFLSNPPRVVSDRQLAGYLTHTLLPDEMRGGPGTYYTIVERDGAYLRVFSVRRSEDGQYLEA